MHIHVYSLKSKSLANIHNIIGRLSKISAYVQHRLTKLVVNESLDNALLCTINICKLAHLHIHELSLKLIFGETSETKQINVVARLLLITILVTQSLIFCNGYAY